MKLARAPHLEKHKLDKIREGQWKDSSGKLHNLGCIFFLELMDCCVPNDTNQCDPDHIIFAQIAIIRTGIALNTNGEWEVGQLTPELQAVVRKHSSNFDGASVEAMKD